MDYKFLQIPNLTVDTETLANLLNYSTTEDQYNAHCVVLNMLGQTLPVVQYKNVETQEVETQEVDYSATIKLIIYDAVINGKFYYKPAYNNYLCEHSTLAKYFMSDESFVVDSKFKGTVSIEAPVDEAKYHPIEPQAPVIAGIPESVFLKTLAIVTGKATNLNLGDM